MSDDGPRDDDERLALAWRVAPATMTFVLDVERTSRNSRDLVDGLIFAAIQSANVQPITNDPELQVRYATLAQPPPDDLRRPVSVSAIANSLRMPFETARRRIQALVQLGALQMSAKGVLVTHATMGHHDILANVFARHELLKLFYLALRPLGALPPVAAGPQPASPDPPLRLTNRLIWDYMLRVTDGLGAVVGDTTRGVILLAMAQENIAGLRPHQLTDWARDPLALAQPVRNGALASSLAFSSETLRRHVIALEARGFCVRGPRGLVAVVPPVAQRALERMAVDNLGNLQRLFGRLRQFGVLDTWDGAALAAQ